MDFGTFLRMRDFLPPAYVEVEYGISCAELARYEAGECLPPPEVLPRLALALLMRPRRLAQLLQESLAGGISPASLWKLQDEDRRRNRRLALQVLARPQVTPEQRAVCEQLLGHWVHCGRPLRSYLE